MEEVISHRSIPPLDLRLRTILYRHNSMQLGNNVLSGSHQGPLLIPYSILPV